MIRKPGTALRFGASAWIFLAGLVACERTPTDTVSSSDALLAASDDPAAELLQGSWENTECSVSISGNTLFYMKGDEWYEAEFTLPAVAEPKQLHATILADGTGSERDIGTVIVALYKIEDETLTLVALTDGAPTDSLETTESLGRYIVERSEPKEGRTGPPAG